MANCKDCVHCYVCLESDKDLTCKDFKDSSQFVELPCKVGDTVYFPTNDRHSYAQITCIRLESDEIYFEWAQYDFHPECTELWDQDEFKLSDIGKTVFLTREEAEQKLKERMTDEKLGAKQEKPCE